MGQPPKRGLAKRAPSNALVSTLLGARRRPLPGAAQHSKDGAEYACRLAFGAGRLGSRHVESVAALVRQADWELVSQPGPFPHAGPLPLLRVPPRLLARGEREDGGAAPWQRPRL
eukprot:scaffold7328_cov314-Pinguiococcus_pyrenoidosus.AAC.61